jgi:SNF2 family DNA or RNA helicase
VDQLPEKMKALLYPFQREGIEFGLKKYGRLLLGDEMGVGKTI